jgi:hypothetical protein
LIVDWIVGAVEPRTRSPPRLLLLLLVPSRPFFAIRLLLHRFPRLFALLRTQQQHFLWLAGLDGWAPFTREENNTVGAGAA